MTQAAMTLREFQGYEFGWIGADVGDGVGVIAGEPFGVAGFEVAQHGALAFDVAAEIEIRDGDEQVRAGVVVQGDDSGGLEFEFGDADAVFDEENLFGAVGEDDEAAVFIPMSGGVAEGFVLEDFDGDVAEGLIGEIAGDVGEGGGGEARFAILELDGYGRLVFDRVDDFGGAEGDIDVVVPVPVHESLGVGSDVDVEDADGFVLQGEVVMRFVGDFNFGSDGLGGEQREADEDVTVHAGDCSIGHLGD